MNIETDILEIPIYLNKETYDQVIFNQYDCFECELVIYNKQGIPYEIRDDEYILLESIVNKSAYIYSGSAFKVTGNRARFKLANNTTQNSGYGTFNVSIINSTSKLRKANIKKNICIKGNTLDENTQSSELVVQNIEILQEQNNLAEQKINDIEDAVNNNGLEAFLKKSEASNTYQVKESGKGLSTNDFSNSYKKKLDNIFNLIYPVGCYYMSSESTEPSTLFGIGTWERVKGKVLVGVDEDDTDFTAVGKTGGEKIHTLLESEIPQFSTMNYRGGNVAVLASAVGSNYSLGYTRPFQFNGNELDVATKNIGGNGAHNNLQPYITTYIWHRTA